MKKFFKKRCWRSLSARIAIAFAVMSIVLTLAIVALMDIVSTGPARTTFGQALTELALQTTEKLDQGMFERYREMLLVSRQSVLRQLATSAERDQLRPTINSLQDTYPYYAWIGLTDVTGKVLVSTNGLLEGVDVSQRPWWKNAFNGIYAGDVHAAKLLEKKLPRSQRYPNDPIRFVDIAFPVSDKNGKILGILGAHLNWEWAKDVSRSIVEPVAKRGNVEMMIVAKDGTVLLGPPDVIETNIDVNVYLKGQHDTVGYVEEVWQNGKRYLVGFSGTRGYQSYHGLGWTVLVRQPVEEAYAPIRSVQKMVLVLGAIVAVGFCLLGFLIAREISRPIVDLARSAGKVASGESSSLAKVKASYPELHDLAESFGKMLQSVRLNEVTLRALNQTLENRVADRTRELETSQRRLQMITDNVPALIALSDAECRYVFCNKSYAKWIGKDREEVIGKYGWEVLEPETFLALRPNIDRALAGEEVRFESVRMIAGEPHYREVCYIPTSDTEDTVIGFYVLAYDITERKKEQLALEYDVLHDVLTGLPNRKALMQEIPHALARGRRNKTSSAVLFLDVDRFKQINDTYGHGIGDDVLIAFAQRLKEAVRETDMVARLAGDEFVILAEGLEDGGAGSREIARKILAALEAPFEIESNRIPIGTSIGVALAIPSTLVSPEALLEQADKGMYAAKQAGRNCFRMGNAATLAAVPSQEAA